MREREIHYAKVKTWFDDKGFGFLAAKEHGEPFVHITNVRGAKISDWDWVQYKLRPSKKKPGTFEAIDVLPFGVASQVELEAVVVDAVSEIPGGKVLLDFGIEALSRLGDQSQWELVQNVIKGEPDSTYSKLKEQFSRKGLRSLASKLSEAEQQLPGYFDSSQHLESWKNGATAMSPSLSRLIDLLTQGFQEADHGGAARSSIRVSSSRRCEWMRRAPETEFVKLLKAVDGVRVRSNVRDWVRELQELAQSLGADDKRHAPCVARLNWLLNNSLSSFDRVDLFLSQELGAFDIEATAGSWLELSDELRRKFMDREDLSIHQEALFRKTIDRHGYGIVWLDSWLPWLQEREDFKKLLEPYLEECDAAQLLEMWFKHLLVDLPLEAFMAAMGNCESHSLEDIERHGHRLSRESWVPHIQSALDDFGAPNSVIELDYLERLVNLPTFFKSEGEANHLPFHKAVVDKNRLERWSKSEQDDWVGVDLIRRTTKYVSPDQHVANARKFFFHVEQGDVTPSEKDFFDMLEVGTKEDMPFAERTTWRIIDGLVRESKWMRFEDILGSYSDSDSEGLKGRLNVWPLLDKCAGRTELKWPRKMELFDSRWSKVSYVDFTDDDRILIKSKYSDREEVRGIGGVRWIPDERVWELPRSREADALHFAREHSYHIRRQGSFWKHNEHLAELGETPLVAIHAEGACIRCEGRKALITDAGRDFWWCRNEKCYRPAQEYAKTWKTATLLDFLRILEIPLNDEDSKGRQVVDGAYQKLMAGINRFLVLRNRLVCNWKPANYHDVANCSCADKNLGDGCSDLMKPSGHSNFGYYRTTHFSCDNESCSKNGHDVYLHHCGNKSCQAVIDSRISAKCPNGLYVCSECGFCCSDDMKNRRSENLKTVGVTRNAIMTEGWGHREKGVQFCACCGTQKRKVSKEQLRFGQVELVDHFVCDDCRGPSELRSGDWIDLDV